MEELILPPLVRVRISSEGAEGIGLSPVVSREMATVELVAQILGVTGKDAPRVQETLVRGSLIVGGSRFRWASIDCELEALLEYLKQYPDTDPSLTFERDRCYLAAFRSGTRSIVVERKAGEKRRLFKRQSFWDALMEIIKPVYREYSYREEADLFRWQVDAPDRLIEAAKLLTWSSYEHELRSGAYNVVDLFCKR